MRLLSIFLLATAAFGQTVHNANFEVRGETITIQRVSSLPGTCAAGRVAIQTSDNTLHWCSSTDTWTALGSAASSNILTAQGRQSDVTLDGSGTGTLYSYVMPGSTMAAGGCIEVQAACKKAGTNSYYPRLTFGSALTYHGGSEVSNNDWVFQYIVCNNASSTSAQTGVLVYSEKGTVDKRSNGLSPDNTFTATEDTTGNVTVAFKIVNGTSGDLVTPLYFIVKNLQ